jgi:hypothetical protein
MSPAPENPPVHPDELLLFSLISAEFDGELSPAECAELRKLERLHPGRANAFRGKCAHLQANLQQLPVIPTELQGDSMAARPWTMKQASTPPQSEFSPKFHLPASLRPPIRRAFAVVTTLLVCVLCVMFLRPPFPDQSPAESIPSLSDARMLSSSAESQAAATLQVPPALAAPAVPIDIAAAAPSASADAASPSIGELQPLLTESDWQVVVVRVRRGGPEDVLKELREVLGRHGLTLARSRPVTTPEWLGVFLPASIPHRKSLLAEVQQGLAVDAPEWDPTDIMRSSRESILEAVRQSLASPTRSELAGGEVFVAVSPAISRQDPALARTQNAVPQVPGARAPQAGAAVEAAGPKQTPASKEPGLSALLLVFEFSQEAGDAGQRRIF